MAIEFSERIRRMPVYPVAGGYADEAPLVRLASNESPYPPLQEVRDAISRALPSLNRYPDPSNSLLRRRLSERYDVPASRIAIGNGSCDILLAAGEALLEPGAELVHAWPSFSVYPHLSAASGARAVTVPLDLSERHDLDAMLAKITAATRLVVVCNPNNPTSTALPLADIARFLAEVPPEVCVIVDEAYCEFNLLEDPDASIELLDAHPNLALLRTFSKVHGLCGLRVGFALCGSEELPRALDQVRQPFFCNALAQAAALEALAHQDAVIDRVALTVAERNSVGERLAALGIETAESQANFCWLHLGSEHDETEVMRGLQERGVLVRAGRALGSQTPALRVTYGLPEDNDRFLAALAEVLQPAPAR
ncbi:MAG: aminotransferase class I/II-fold pyridoxal phosphate-dependent enzyme [Solirubrobacterales bacterium]|jgi:histidinol-phosphate aminotransferase|nr:aminotransferase class I/II-fold pyridoxal phosphate-dependent enzyme [Solirubrobacterales bacterium]